MEMDAHCFHKVPCGRNVRVDELGGDDATSGVADTVWRDLDGQELEGQLHHNLNLTDRIDSL